MKMRSTGIVPPLATLTAVLVCFTTVVAAAPRQFTADLVAPQEIRIGKFDDVIASILNGDPSEQARFAVIAIEIMVASFMDELERADVEARGNRQDDLSWKIGTRRYIEHLRSIAASIQRGSALRIIKEPHTATRLVIEGEQVMLSAPRLEDQAVFERNIAENVCRYAECIGRGATIEGRVAERSSRLESGWEFGRKAPPTYSSSDGLQCIFRDRRHLKLKKDACLSLVYELRLLAEAFLALDAHGKRIEWRALRIDHVGAGKEQKVTYSSNGSFVRMHLPRLLRAEALWREAIPWIKANLQGKVSQHVITLPDQLVYLTSTNESQL